jgi:hypothetical protein
MIARTAKKSKSRGGSSSHDNTAIVANNCNNLIVAILASASGRQYCRTN